MVAWTWQKSSCVVAVSGGLLLISLFISVLALTGRGSKTILTEYVSYPGGSYPENGVFNLLLYVSAIFGSILTIMRYVDVEARAQYRSAAVDHINKVSLFIGIVSMVAVAVIASYPIISETEINTFNEAGTYVLFVGGALYCAIQTGLSFYFSKCSPCFITRLLIFVVTVAAVIASPTLLAYREVSPGNGTTIIGENNTIVAFAYLSQGSVETSYVTSSAICQRIALLALSVFQLSFIWEFKKISGYIIIRSDAVPTPTVSFGDSWVQAHKSWSTTERF